MYRLRRLVAALATFTVIVFLFPSTPQGARARDIAQTAPAKRPNGPRTNVRQGMPGARSKRRPGGQSSMASSMLPKSGSKYVGWDVFCSYADSAKDDPIVKPGQPGASHSHDFFGNMSTDAFSTYQTMTDQETTCDIPEDTAAYWVPSLYVDGRQVVPGTGRSLLSGRPLGVKVRYYSTTIASAGVTYSLIPADLRMVVGVSSATTPAENPTLGSRMYWGCTPQEDRPLGVKARGTAPRHCASGVTSLFIRFPNCWDGVHTDSPDHRSHVANSDTKNHCPTGYPMHLPPIILYIEYFVGPNWNRIELASGDTSSVHADFWNTWNQSALNHMIEKCLFAKRWCGTFD